MARIPATGWYVEVDNPDTGHTWTPSVVGEPQWRPDLLPGLPRIEIPVPKADKWDADWADEAPMRAWYDGQRLAIEELEKTRQTPGATVLVGIGGVELREPIRTEYARGEPIDDAAKTIVQDNTGYGTDFDAPSTQTFADQTIQDIQTTADFKRELARKIPDDVPVGIRNGGIELQQSLFLGEGEDNIYIDINAAVVSDSDASQGEVAQLNTEGDSVRISFENKYEWSAGVNIVPRTSSGTNRPPFTISFDDEVISENDAIIGSSSGYSWSGAFDEFAVDPDETHTATIEVTASTGIHTNEEEFNANHGTWVNLSKDRLEDGSEEVTDLGGSPTYIRGVDYEMDYLGGRIKTLSSGSMPDGDANTIEYDYEASYDELNVDILAAHDLDFNPTTPATNDLDADQNFPGPELYRESAQQRFDDAETIHALTNIDEVALSIDDTSNKQAIAVSTDGGQTWDEETNTATHSGVAISGTVISARARLTLSRYDDGRDATPTQGNSGQRVTSLTMQADQESLPYVNDEAYHESAKSVLGDLANKGDFVGEVTHDGSGIVVAWTRSGQRSANREAPVTDYEFERSNETLVQKATIKGSSTFRFDERFDADHGTAVPLDHDDLVVGSEEVADPEFGGNEYERGVDYEMDYANGEITVLAAGDMSNATEFSIDYRWRIKGAYDDGTADPRSIVRTIPELTTARACNQAAFTIVDSLNTPSRPTQVVLPSVEPGWSLVEELELEQLPTGIPLQIKGIQPTPEQTVVRLDTRESVGDVISDIQDRVEGLARTV
jgi:hypothetical protein